MNLSRVWVLKEGREQAGPVVYWMSRDQRVGDNWALSFAQTLALRREAPLVVVFALAPRFLEATRRQYRFMLSGLQEVERALAELNIPLLLIPGSPPRVIPELVEQSGRHAGDRFRSAAHQTCVDRGGAHAHYLFVLRGGRAQPRALLARLAEAGACCVYLSPQAQPRLGIVHRGLSQDARTSA